MIKRIMENKFAVSLLIILIVLSAFFTTKILAVNDDESNTVLSAEHDPNHYVGQGRYIPFADLQNYYDYFCCYHGGVGSHIPSAKDVILRTEQGEKEESTLKITDIGKKEFEVTLDGSSTTTPFVQGSYTNETYGFYKAVSTEICSPKEAYILAEMKSNMPYPSEVQKAWWTTTAGSHGATKLASNELALEAEAFEAYILEAAGVSSVDQLKKDQIINYQYNNQDKTLDCGFDIKYEPKYNVDANQDGREDPYGTDKITVSWDSVEQCYKIGPFSIDYIEASIKSGNRPEVMFAGITEAYLYTDYSDQPLERGKDWNFLWLNGERDNDDDYEFPHKNEVFYVKLNYKYGQTKFRDLQFDFKYMNAAGKYDSLQGTYYTATWDAKEKSNYCTEPKRRPYYNANHELVPGKTCSHGYYTSHVKSTTYWVQLTKLEENKAQLLALGLSAARIENKAHLELDEDHKTNEAKIIIRKNLVDENGNEIDSNKTFKFRIYINGRLDRTITVRANSSNQVMYTWGEDEPTPTYKVEEVPDSNTQLIDIQNAEGTLVDNSTVVIRAVNQIIDRHDGYLRIVKKVVGNDDSQEYQFRVKIGNSVNTVVRISKSTGWQAMIGPVRWYGDNAPYYEVDEINLPEGAKLISVTNSRGYLNENRIAEADFTNEVVKYYGQLVLDKTVIGDPGDAEFTFKVTINNDVKEVKLSKAKGWEWKSDIYEWYKTDGAPHYSVEEVNIPEGFTLKSITPKEGILPGGNSPSQPGLVNVTAINGTEKYLEGYIKLEKKVTGTADPSLTYTFNVTVQGAKGNPAPTTVSIKAGQSINLGPYLWKEGEPAPTYKIEEVNIPEGYKLKSFENQEGTLVAGGINNAVYAVATNDGLKVGNVKITKIIDGNAPTDEIFTFELKINNAKGFEKPIIVNLKAGQPYKSPDITWGINDPTPTYEVREIDIPEDAELVEIQNATGEVKENSTQDVSVTATAINRIKKYKGKVRVTKEVIIDDKVQDEAIDGTFKISVTITGTFLMNGESVVNGTRTITNSLHAGESFETPEIEWYGNNAPTYTVSESDIPEGWELINISSESGQLEPDQTIDIMVTNHFPIDIVYDLTMDMAGDVWEDAPLNEEDKNTEDSVANGLYDRDVEEPIDGVLVNIYRVVSNGDQEVYRELATGYIDDANTPLQFPIVTGKNTEPGHWEAPRMEVPALKEEEKDTGYTVKYDVEFIYDGQTYEPTTLLKTSDGNADTYIKASTSERDKWQNDSMALDTNREDVDNRLAEIKGDTPIDENGNTDGLAVGMDGTTNNIEYSSTKNPNVNRRISELITTDENGMVKEVFRAKATTQKAGLLYPFDNRMHLLSIDKKIDELGAHYKYTYSATYGYVQHINLGLKRRPTADLAVAKDLVSATVAVNGKIVEYKYNKLLDKLTLDGKEVEQVLVPAKEEIQGYDLKLYGSDYYYRTQIYESDTELYNDLNKYFAELGLENVESKEADVFLKYRLRVYNQSAGGYDAEINELLDYYDETLELVQTQVKKYVQTETENGLEEDVIVVAEPSTCDGGRQVDWILDGTEQDKDGKKYNKMKTTSLSDMKVKAGENITIDVTFKVGKNTNSEGIENSIRIEGNEAEKSNIVEISSYTTYYKDSDKIAGKVDKDSAPDNINFNLEENDTIEGWFEDDASAAPTLTIGLYGTKRNIDGMAWEDLPTEKVGEYNEYVGNGKYDENENKLGGMDTTLVEKITVKHYEGDSEQKDESGNTLYKEYDFIWPTDTPMSFLGSRSIKDLTGFSSKVTTSEDASTEGEYKFEAIPAGNFVVRFTYGNKDLSTAPSNEKIKMFNGHDYKTTTYQAGFEHKDENGIANNEWHDLYSEELATQRVSDARDSEARRLELIEKDKVITNVNGEKLAIINKDNATEEEKQKIYDEYYMNADTAKLNIEIEKINEKNRGINITTLEGNTITAERTVQYDIKNIDVGIEERSKTEIALDKQISRITITTSDNNTIFDAQYDINYTFNVDESTGETTWEAKPVLKESSIGTAQLQAIDDNEKEGRQGRRYINIDDKILQGTTIRIEYTISALNVGEVDLIGKELEEAKTAEEVKTLREKLVNSANLYAKVGNTFARNNLVGQYLGSTYYNGTANEGNKDVVASAKVLKTIDYVDNDAVFSSGYNMEKDNSWAVITEEELLGNGEEENRIISSTKGIFKDIDGKKTITDPNGVKYNTENKSNIIVSVEYDQGEQVCNPGFMKTLIPYAGNPEEVAKNDEDQNIEYMMSQIKLVTTRFVGTETKKEDMDFDNISEIVKYETSTGKRDIDATPGTANPSDESGVFTVSLKERDTSATEVITLTPPTGADLNKVMGTQIILVILIGLVIIAVGIVIIKKTVLSK